MGIIECNGREGVSGWEKPESIIVVQHLACESVLPVVGREKGFVKVQLGTRVFAYVNAENIRIVEVSPAPQIGFSVYEPRDSSLPQKKPASKSFPEFSRTVPETVKEPLHQSERDTTLKSGLEFGLDSSYIKYEEPGFMKETGVTLSLYGNYTLRPADFMVRLEGRLGFAGMNYSSSETGETKKIRDYIGEARALVGYTFAASNKWYMTPYMGFGYRYLFDGLGGKVTTSGHLGYDRRSNYLYSPIGMDIAAYLKHRWALVMTGEYDLFWKGWQESDIGELFGSSPTVTNDQEKGWGLRASGKFVKETGSVDLAFGPYMKYWNIDDSKPTSLIVDDEELIFIEPANTSIEVGGMFGVVF
jgi:hypothetical protein